MEIKRFLKGLIAVLVAFALGGTVELRADVPVRKDTLAESRIVASNRMDVLHTSKALPVTKVYMKRLELEQRLTFKDMSALVPNLYVPDYGSKMTSSIYIRGLGARIDNPVMGMYVDGIALANKNSYDFNLVDIRSIDVFRGPQGTLFGRNTMGGLMSIITLSPLHYQGTKGSITYGNGNNLTAKLAHYAKINSTAGIGVSAYYQHTDGFFRNKYVQDHPQWNDTYCSGSWGDKSLCDWSDEAGARLKAEWKGSRGVSFVNTLMLNYVNQGGFPYEKISSIDPITSNQVNYNDFCGYRRANILEGLSYTWTGDRFKFSGATTYQLTVDRMDMDQDYQPLSYFTLIQAQNDHHLSQEFSFAPKQKKENGWDWITGASAYYRNLGMSAPVTFKEYGIEKLILENANKGIASAFENHKIKIQEDTFVIGSDFMTNALGAALYHTSYYRIDGWQFEAGLRLDLEHSAFRYNSNADIHYLFTATMADYKKLSTLLKGRESLTYIEPLPRLAISKDWKHCSVYASGSKGYKAGGFNTQLFSDILQNQMMTDMMDALGVYFDDNSLSEYTVADVITYKPEESWNFETGFKGTAEAGDLRFDLEASLFWIETFNQQLTVFPAKGTGRLMTNAGRSRSLGAEASMRLGYKRFGLDANYGYTNARFVKYDNGKADYSGNVVPYIPANTLGLSARYSIDINTTCLSRIDLNLRGDGYGKIWWNEENTLSQPFYMLMASTVSFAFTNGWSIDLWGKNLTGNRYNTFYFVSMGNAFLQRGRPTTYGLTLNFDF
jgi:outer membrane receptor protein involved in Fe transport